jgi:hypothetical protein
MNTLLLLFFVLFIARLMIHFVASQCFPTQATRGCESTICSDICLIYLRGVAFVVLEHKTDICVVLVQIFGPLTFRFSCNVPYNVLLYLRGQGWFLSSFCQRVLFASLVPGNF